MNWSQSLKLKLGMKMRKNFHCFPIESQIVRQNINLVPIFAFALTFVPVFGNQPLFTKLYAVNQGLAFDLELLKIPLVYS